MTDCGTSGSTIDRAMAVISGQSSSSGKNISELFSHFAMGHQSMPMPTSAPTQIYNSLEIPQPTIPVELSCQQSDQNLFLDQAWRSPDYYDQVLHVTYPGRVHHHLPTSFPTTQIEGSHPQVVMMQQQYIMQMQMQMQMMAHQQQQLDLANQTYRTVDNHFEHQEEDLQVNALEDFDSLLSQGATIDDLAAAWAEAEAEYDRERLSVDLSGAIVTDLDQHHYTFQNVLPEKSALDHDWMDIGLQEYNRGNISEAIRCFETLLQAHDDHAKAWYYLGKCHAENDLDVQAITCLERSVERDPFNPEALLALGVSYVNELNHKKALQSLKEWITHNPKYADLPTNDLYGCEEESELERVQGLLLRALEHDSSPDVHEALGVVFNVSRDYEAAVQSFERALAVRPHDYSLWNKLGATLANANSSEKALPAYQKALSFRPKYARAWLNMAISHSNMQNYDQAARCYLQTLSLNPLATHCWSYLRIALSCQEQWDLLPLISNQDLKAFVDHYDFVLYQ
jgi:peroxin-5